MKSFEPKQGIQFGRGKLFLLMAASAMVWWSLGWLDRGVPWLTVETPRQAVAGEFLPMRIRVTDLETNSLLCVDLHWASVREVANGYLASGGAKPVGREGGSFDFEIMVPATNGLHFVNGIIFLSPTGDWSNHTFVAATELIPVTSNRSGEEQPLVRLPARQMAESRRQDGRWPSAVPRVLTGILLLVAAAVSLKTVSSIPKQLEALHQARRWWLVLTVVLTLGCIWEQFGLENRLGNQARALARAEDYYHARALFQKGIISVTIAATVVSFGFLWGKRTLHWPLIPFTGLYLALSVVNLLSFHSLDQYAGLSWHGITLVEAMKCACAVAILKAVLQAHKLAP